MPYSITLPTSAATSSRILGGLTFVDGVATVEDIGQNRRTYFEGIGATVEDISVPDPQSPEDVAALTLPQLSRLAAAKGITHSSRTRHARLVSLINTHLFPEEE